jgi:CRP/FNR family transcriptional regulator, cyclic AMP receptor protein
MTLWNMFKSNFMSTEKHIMIAPSKLENLKRRMQNVFRFFKLLSDDELRAFLSFCENRQVDSGTLWDEGDSDNYAAFIVAGKVGIKKQTEFEGKHMIVGTFSPGTVVGELCLLTNLKRSVTAVVLEPVDIVILSNEKFEMLMANFPLLGLKLLRHIFLIITCRLNRSTDRIAKIF